MRWVNIGCGVLVLAVLSGCGMLEGNNYQEFRYMSVEHDTAQYNTISNQANAIANVANTSSFSTPVEAALFKVIAVQSIEKLKYHNLNVNAPKTGYDVLNTVAGNLPTAIFGLTTYGIAKNGFDSAGQTNVTADNMNVSDSFNKQDVVVGNGTTSAVLKSQPTEVIDTTSTTTSTTGTL